MPSNALLPYCEKMDRDRVNNLQREADWRCCDSVLLNFNIEAFGVGDIYYLTAETLYSEFEKVDDVLQDSLYYNEKTMLALMEDLLGKRYPAFKYIYDRKYQHRPDMTVEEFLSRFESYMGDTLKMNGIKRYKKGITSNVKTRISKSMEEMIIYFRAIEEHELAHEIWKHYTDDMKTPETQKSFISSKVKFYTPRMVERCNIHKPEAEMLLKNTLEKLFS